MSAPDRIDPEWGAPYGGTRFMTEDGKLVWMHRRGQRCRFFNDAGEQVGAEHRNVAPAVIWAYAAGWHDPSNPVGALMMRAEIARNSRPTP